MLESFFFFFSSAFLSALDDMTAEGWGRRSGIRIRNFISRDVRHKTLKEATVAMGEMWWSCRKNFFFRCSKTRREKWKRILRLIRLLGEYGTKIFTLSRKYKIEINEHWDYFQIVYQLQFFIIHFILMDSFSIEQNNREKCYLRHFFKLNWHWNSNCYMMKIPWHSRSFFIGIQTPPVVAVGTQPLSSQPPNDVA